MLNVLGLQSCNLCDLCGSNYGKEGYPPQYHAPTQKVEGWGELPCDILFLAEAPGEHEDKQGIPFVGDSGKLLRAMITEAGLDKLRLFITNTARCRPPRNRKPTPQEVETCSLWTGLELEAAAPKVIVCLGATAVSYFLPKRKLKGKVGDYVGKMFSGMAVNLPDSEQPCLVFGCYHPAARDAKQRATIPLVLCQVATLFGIEAEHSEEATDYQLLRL